MRFLLVDEQRPPREWPQPVEMLQQQVRDAFTNLELIKYYLINLQNIATEEDCTSFDYSW